MAFGDKLGRRKTLFVGMIIVIIGAALQASSFSLAQLSVSRVMLVGFEIHRTQLCR
jgi:MFS family permease